MSTFKVAIIGTGKIGALFDSPSSQYHLSHAHGYHSHPGFEIVGMVDEDVSQLEEASSRWGVEKYRNLQELFASRKVDVVSVCTSTDSHLRILTELQEYPDLLGGIIEKPLASSLADALTIKDSAFYRERKFLVNYKRRFLPEYQLIQKNILSNKYGDMLNGVVYYGRGVRNNASHAIDTLRFFGIDVDCVESVKKRPLEGMSDFDCDTVLSLRTGGSLHLVAIPAAHYKIFELDLFFEKARIKIQDEGQPIVEQAIVEDKLFPGYFTPTLSTTHASNAGGTMSFVVKNLYDALTSDAVLQCTIEDGYEAQRVADSISGHL